MRQLRRTRANFRFDISSREDTHTSRVSHRAVHRAAFFERSKSR